MDNRPKRKYPCRAVCVNGRGTSAETERNRELLKEKLKAKRISDVQESAKQMRKI